MKVTFSIFLLIFALSSFARADGDEKVIYKNYFVIYLQTISISFRRRTLKRSWISMLFEGRSVNPRKRV